MASLPSYFFSFRLDDLNALDFVAASDSIDNVHAFRHLAEDCVTAIFSSTLFLSADVVHKR